MKITLITKNFPWEYEQLVNTAKEESINFEVKDISSINDLENFMNDLGDVVIYRTCSLDKISKLILLNNIAKKKILLNLGNAKNPNVVYKTVQQLSLKDKFKINTIPTFQFNSKAELLKAVENNILSYPFILKPNLGKQGIGVKLVKDIDMLNEIEEIEFKTLIFQNFIENSGDFRVFVVGNKVIGVMKRIAKEGNFLNNISQGGSGEKITGRIELSKLNKIASTVASVFELNICGVDVIYDNNKKDYFFLEVNTAPQWQGFQTATGVNVALEILNYCKRLYAREVVKEIKDTHELIRNTYDQNTNKLYDSTFHYASRMYLWTKEDKYLQMLNNERKEYLGITEDETTKRLTSLINKNTMHEFSKGGLSFKTRKPLFEKYPMLMNYNFVLFKLLFAETIYKADIRPIVKSLIKDEELKKLYNEIIVDREALAVLSTHAINFIYLTKNYFRDEIPEVDTSIFIDIFESDYKEHLETFSNLKIYLLTHCIIGRSRFYAEDNILEPQYLKMCELLEKYIEENFFDVTIDNKFEFLVCARLCNYNTERIEKLIYSEALKSFGNTTDFLIDRYNRNYHESKANTFCAAEHRNVLFLMGLIPKK